MEWQGPMWNDCGCCNSVRRDVERGEGRRWCLWCERDAMERLRNLAHNLAIAAGLCMSYRLGHGAGIIVARAVMKNIAYLPPWFPNCGRSAP